METDKKNIYFAITTIGVIAGFSLILSGYIFLRQQSLTQAFIDSGQLNQGGIVSNNSTSAPLDKLKEISGSVRAMNEGVIVISAQVPAIVDVSNPNPPATTLKDYSVTIERSTTIELIQSISPSQNSRPEDLISAPVIISMQDIKIGDLVKVTADKDVTKANYFVAKTLTVFR